MKNKKAGRRSAPHVGENGGLFCYIGAYVAFALFVYHSELFQRIKRHLERETLRTGKKLTQRDFVLNLITQALDEADAENATEQNTPTEAPVVPRVADVTAPADTDTPHEDNAV